jgi:hypothetical protein
MTNLIKILGTIFFLLSQLASLLCLVTPSHPFRQVACRIFPYNFHSFTLRELGIPEDAEFSRSKIEIECSLQQKSSCQYEIRKFQNMRTEGNCSGNTGSTLSFEMSDFAKKVEQLLLRSLVEYQFMQIQEMNFQFLLLICLCLYSPFCC